MKNASDLFCFSKMSCKFRFLKSILLSLSAILLSTGFASGQFRSPAFVHNLAAGLGLQGRIMWVDGSANIDRITTREGVNDIVARCKRAKFNAIVIDVKPVVGQVLYNSKIAEHIREWKGKIYPDFDVLAAFVDEGHKAGLEVSASFNVFSEGHKYFSKGLAYKNKEWQSMAYNVDRSLIAADGYRLPIRADNEPEDSKKTVVFGEDHVERGTANGGAKLAVCLNSAGRVEGLIDPAILGEEPLAAPEDGRLMVLSGEAMAWANQHVKAGDRARFDASGLRVPVADAATEKIAAFVNPLHPAARAYELSLLQEVAANYAVDGIVFDRTRYANLFNDYSNLTRSAFEKWLGKPVDRWPDDVIKFDPSPGADLQRGPLYKPWLEFRATVIRDFLREATDRLRRVKPVIRFGVYAGSWFSEYFGVGVNWGSEKFPVRFSWAAPDYNETGYAEFLDWLSTGCYYPFPTREDARAAHRDEGGSVEAAADLSVAAVRNSIPLYAGIYALDYERRPADFARAIEVAARRSQGVMVFDLSYIYDYNWWDILDKAFANDSIAPHRVPGFAKETRTVQDAIN